MTPNPMNISSREVSKKVISLADGSYIKASHSGLSPLPLNEVTSIPSLLVPELQEPLLSVSALCERGVTGEFTKSNVKFFQEPDVSYSDKPLGNGFQHGNLYYLPKQVGVSFSTTV